MCNQPQFKLSEITIEVIGVITCNWVNLNYGFTVTCQWGAVQKLNNAAVGGGGARLC